MFVSCTDMAEEQALLPSPQGHPVPGDSEDMMLGVLSLLTETQATPWVLPLEARGCGGSSPFFSGRSPTLGNCPHLGPSGQGTIPAGQPPLPS